MNNKLYKRALVALSCLGAVLLLSVEASATDVYQINASGTDQTNPDNGSRVITSLWSLIFDDRSGDGLVQTDEIISFSGATVTTISPDPDSAISVRNVYEYDELVGTPDVTDISESSGFDESIPCCWWFDGPETAATPELPFDGWYPRRWTYEKVPLADYCDVPVGLDEVMDNLANGFTVDPSSSPQPSIVLASQGNNIRGFVDLERSDVISTQCDSDYFAIYAWFGAGDGSDLTKVNDFFASLGTLQFLIDGDPVTNIVTDAVDGFRPSGNPGQPSGIIVAAYIVEPFELSPGTHIASLDIGCCGTIFQTPFTIISVDDDGDGVNNGFDLCPMTPPDAAVDINGCTSDEAAESVIDEIDALLADPSLSDKAGKNLGKAQDKLGDALAELAGGDIKKALKKVGDAAKELLKAEKEGADVGGLVDQLIVLAETQARRAVDAAIAAGGDPKEIGKAEKELGKADDELAKGKPDKAIDRYAKAWDHARKA